MTEVKTIFGTYTYFNEIPVHSVFIWGDGLKFIKLANAIPDVGMSKQPPNCFDLQKQHYCTMTAKHKVKLVKQTADYNTEVIVENSGDMGDLISREALKAYARKVICGDNPTNSLIIRMFDEIIDNASAEVELERDQSYEDPNYTSVSTGYATYTAEDIRTCCYCKHHNTSETLHCACRECINYDRWEHK